MGPLLPTKQVSLEGWAPPKMTLVQHERVKKNLAIHFYVTGTPFQRVEDPHLLKAFQACRSDVQLPSRKDLAGPYLDEVYTEFKSKVESKTSQFVTIVTDGWSDVNRHGVLNYLSVSPETSFLWKVL